VIDPVLAEVAAAYGVATWYTDANRRRADIDPDVVRAVLAVLDVDAGTRARARAALRAAAQRRAPIVLRAGDRAPAGVLHLEDGTEAPATDPPPLGYQHPGRGRDRDAGDRHPRAPRRPRRRARLGWWLQVYALHSAIVGDRRLRRPGRGGPPRRRGRRGGSCW
jgi:4-alpha-glucanotransferase